MSFNPKQIGTDLGYGARSLSRSPGYSIAAILILAIAIGANTAVFSIVEGVLLRPLPYTEPQQLCVLWKSVPQRNIEWDWTSSLTIDDWRMQSTLFQDMATVLRPDGSVVTLKGDDAVPEKMQGSIVSGNFFSVIGVRPILGQTFSTEAKNAWGNVVILSHSFWQQRFGGSKSILGKTLEIDGRSMQIIGVMPAAFQFPDKNAKLWLQLEADPRWPAFQKHRVADAFLALGRLKPDATIPLARAEMNGIAARLGEQYRATDKGLGIRVVPLVDQIAGPQVRQGLWILNAVVLCVLLIACSNIGGLLLARAAGRQQEFAIRSALGASRLQLIWQLGTEGILLSLAGGIGGIWLAYAGLNSLLAIAPLDLPRSDSIAINGSSVAFSIFLSALTSAIFSILPARQIAGFTARGSTATPGVLRLRGMLVGGQFALAVILLSGAGLLIRSFLLLNAAERGFDTSRLITIDVALPHEKYKDQARRDSFYEQALAKLAALPGVQGAAIGVAVMEGFRGNVPNQNLVVDGHPFDADMSRHARTAVSEEYFHLMGIPLLEGRRFSNGDAKSMPLVALINRTMAKHLWPSVSPTGKRFKEVLPGLDGQWITVVGVVGDAIYNRDGLVKPIYYSPSQQAGWQDRQIVIRTTGDPHLLLEAASRAVQSIDPALPRFGIRTVAERLDQQDRPRHFQTKLLVIFAAIALILAAVGLFGLMAYSVQLRSREIGIRLALGSSKIAIVILVQKQGLLWGIGGIAVGCLGAAAFGRILAAYLFGVTPMDPVTLTTVIAALIVVMATASAIPCLQATKVNISKLSS